MSSPNLIWLVKRMKQRLKQVLASRQKQHIIEPGRVQSAVLLPMYYKEGQYYLLFIKRTEKVSEHKGQVSFPGGAYEAEDKTLLETALRESAEEIGLSPGDVQILGALDDTVTITSSYIISPFVGLIPWPYRFEADGEEVDEIFEVPIPALLDEDFMCQETEVVDGEAITAYTYHYQGRVIWGATARILNQFLDIFRRIGE